MSIVDKVISQCSNPRGWLGRLNLWSMNIRHAKVTDWGLESVSMKKNDTILDVGCGGGRTVHKLAAIASEGKVVGIDHSKASVAAAQKTNKQWIKLGRVEIQQANVSHLPFAHNTFDLVTAVETHYFWPDLPADMREILRTMKPGGQLAIVAEAYKGGKHDKRMQQLAEMTSMKVLSIIELRELFAEAGFSDVQIKNDYDKGWICGVGRKAV